MSGKPKQIVGCVLYDDGPFFHTMEIVGGPQDGTVWRVYKVTFDDGSTQNLWAADGGTNFYRQVMVPWDFEHPAIL